MLKKSALVLLAALSFGLLIPSTAVASSYSTAFNANNTPRTHNIVLAATKLNGVIIEPGEEFSYNDTIGPTGKSAGFRKARIFIDGEERMGYGGGVCQVSSTLYNAALELGLEITERHPHSKMVTYVPKDRDAATAHGSVDLRFINNRKTPVRIVAEVSEGEITIELIPLD